MNDHALLVLRKLEARFSVPPLSVRGRSAGVPLGLEVEVRYHAYFPSIYDRYLRNSAYAELSVADQAALTEETTAAERRLLPILESTVACGIPRGADRYWEFALPPATDPALIAGMLVVLRHAGAIPEGYRHSLQITLGGLPATPAVSMLLMALELFHGRPARVQEASMTFTHTSGRRWEKKGQGGVHQKAARDLVGGFNVASELRSLELPDSESGIEDLLMDVAAAAEIIQRMNHHDAAATRIWQSFASGAGAALAAHGLPGGIWRKPHHDPATWMHYSESFNTLRDELAPSWRGLLESAIRLSEEAVEAEINEGEEATAEIASSPN
jgi:hypothetical protein